MKSHQKYPSQQAAINKYNQTLKAYNNGTLLTVSQNNLRELDMILGLLASNSKAIFEITYQFFRSSFFELNTSISQKVIKSTQQQIWCLQKGWYAPFIHSKMNKIDLSFKKYPLFILNAAFAKLKELKYLRLDAIQLRKYPDFLHLLPKLEHLELVGHKQSDLHWNLSKSITNLTNLKTLHLENIGLDNWDWAENLAQLENLQYLYLQDNQLSVIPQNLMDLKQLKQVKLFQNPLWDNLNTRLQLQYQYADLDFVEDYNDLPF
ncbi:MAG: protein phosphatase 1 regulatory subunit 42 [Saprospiraceae bacterium]|nr:protein phosphatase 1 regulatory subunit 42 [Saprospiraceae bacterium]